MREDFIEAKKRLLVGLEILRNKEALPKNLDEEEYANKLLQLMEIVLETNKKLNLTALSNPLEFAELHFLDSLVVCILENVQNADFITDIGTGAGFPGLPLAMLYPQKQFLLIDSLRKRTDFISGTTQTLNIKNVEVVHSRMENIGQDLKYREKCDVALCRAVGKLSVIMEYSLPLVKVGGSFIAYKTVKAEDEIEDSFIARKMLGGSKEVKEYSYADLLPGRNHALYLITKERKTPAKFPRKEGVPTRVSL